MTPWEENACLLADGIRDVVADSLRRQVVRVEMHANPYSSRHATGLSKCVFLDGSKMPVFWKRGPHSSEEGVGRLGSVGYEMDVYRALDGLEPRLAPRLIGVARAGADALLVTSFVDAALRVQRGPQPAAVVGAAVRIGEFQQRATSEGRGRQLQEYDSSVYSTWAERAVRKRPRSSWLRDVSRQFADVVIDLQRSSAVIVHGEYYPDNILLTAIGVTAVDWEWAGMALGEIDLAALTEGSWGKQTVEACNEAYAKSRRFDADDLMFRKRLAASRLYLHLRWIGATSQHHDADLMRHRLNASRTLARQLDLAAQGGASE